MPTYTRQFIAAPLSGGGVVSGSIGENSVIFSPSIGHNHNGVNSTPVRHDNLIGVGSYNHTSLDGLYDRPVALPQTEVSSGVVAANFYRLQAVTPVFVGRAGATAAMLVAFTEEVIGASTNEITVVDITSDAGGATSIVGQGYAMQPYIWFSEAIPGVQISLRYGIEGTLGGLPEGALLVEPLKIAETQADTQAWIAQIKGDSYDANVPAAKNLVGLDGRTSALEAATGNLQSADSDTQGWVAGIKGEAYDANVPSTRNLMGLDGRTSALEAKIGAGVAKEFGMAPEFPNMVFDTSGLPAADGTWLGGFELDGSVPHTFLEWATNVASPQSNRIRIMIKLPHDFAGWHESEPLKIWLKGVGDSANVGLAATLTDVAGAVTNISAMPFVFTSMGTWNQHQLPAISSGSFMAGYWACLTLEATADGSGNTVKIGRIDLKYRTL